MKLEKVHAESLRVCISFPTRDSTRNLPFFSLSIFTLSPGAIFLFPLFRAFRDGRVQVAGQVPARLLQEGQEEKRGKKTLDLSGGHARFNP